MVQLRRYSLTRWACAVCLGVVCPLLYYSFRGRQTVDIPTPGLKTDGGLMLLAREVWLFVTVRGECVPTSNSELATWVNSSHAYLLKSGRIWFDSASQTLVDEWGVSLVILTENGRIVGIGSCGQDGRWDKGHNDDIVVWLTDIERMYDR